MKRVGQALFLLIVVAIPAYAGVPVQVTPEPATIGLVATGVGAVGAIAWWRKRRR
ncbi:MAG: PEP-CTERM sorting domain-containing protein [Gemmatimonas sp.]